MYFGVDDESRKVCTLPIAAPEIIKRGDSYFIATTTPELDGIQMARMTWK